MEEDVGVKVTVTRLRRRLSVEQSEDGSMVGSPGPATPTKKRGGRLATKPQLELIKENTPVSSPSVTRRKSLATTDAEEKTITPSRRSTRVKSNSSIVSDSLLVQATSSPRARRAARRNSQAGSDTEGPATPARQTRRTRKDSASSVENQESGTLNKPLPVAEMVIEEEPENEAQKIVNKSKSSPTAATEELSPNSARKSKRLLEKRNLHHGLQKTDEDCSICSGEDKSLNISADNEKVPTDKESRSRKSLNESVKSKESNDGLSESNVSILNKLETESKYNNLNHNKSASDLDITGNEKSKRNRTESWPAVTTSIPHESINFSDNEVSKKKKGKSDRSFSAINDSKNNISNTIHEKNTSQSFLDTSSKRKKKKSETNIENAPKPCEDIRTEALTPKDNSISDKQIPNDKSDSNDMNRDMAKLFENSPAKVQISVYYEDLDSNDIADKTEVVHSEDQCVPEVKVIQAAEKDVLSNQISDDNDKISSTGVKISQVVSNDVNNSCEPMDIDETIHEEILQTSLEQANKKRQSFSTSQHSIIGETDDAKGKSSVSGFAVETVDQSKNHKSKSSISNTAVDTPDRLKNENRKSSISNTPIDTPNGSKNDKRTSSISSTAVDTPDISIITKRKSSISNTVVATPDQTKNEKRKSSISNTVVDTPDQTKNEKRKSSISNTVVDTPDQCKNGKRKSSVSNTAVDTQDQSKNDKRKSSVSNTAEDTPDGSKNDKRTSSISNSTADTPDLSKDDDNKSTLILSQLKDVSTTSENVKSPKSATVHEVLSKSDINEKGNNEKKVRKGNLSLNDVKGTPKQNSVQKLSMQTSTPITTPQTGIKSKLEKQKHGSPKNNKCNFSKSVKDTDSSQHSFEKNEYLDDEAEEASDDYESGDSRGEEERRYEDEHEIVERGETLTSNDDVSNDTDYEKDSFVVSSDAEDHELLSGSGDDLSMSDNELSMSNKSKKKYNDRKLKEQKKASREMFESRHKLNTSDKNSPSKTKKNRMRIDSSLLASDEELVVTSKKTNRMRLDSTLDTSLKVEEANVSLDKNNKNKSMQGSRLDASVTQEDTNTSLKKKNKKSKHDSIGNKSAIDEKEITVCNEGTIDNADPLQIKLKQEPKTPQKDFNISVVQVRQDIESVQMTESNSILDQTATDPLQATMTYEDTSDSSESEEIMQNYDSVLNELNKGNKTKLNSKNVSLNLGSKTKKNNVEPIIDQLNLTQAKISKKTKDQLKDNSVTKTVTEKSQDSDNEGSSSSIDLQLLFSEDNCGSDDEQQSQQSKADDENMFVPLKKSPGKTNLRDSIEMNTSQKDITLNESSKKKKKPKSSLAAAVLVDDQDYLNGSASKNVNMSIKETGMKKKNKHSLSEPVVAETQDTPNAAEPELNKSTKKKSKSSLAGQSEDNLFFIDTTGTLQDNKDEYGEFHDPPRTIYERKKKKRKNKLVDTRSKTKENENTVEESNADLTPKSEKKKKKRSISEPCIEESQENTSMTSKSEKKKKKHSISEFSAAESQENTITNAAITPKSEKKKKKHSISEPSAEESQGIIAPEFELNESIKKKKRKSSLSAQPKGDLFFIDTAGTLQDNKVNDEDSDGAPDETPYRSEKALEVDSQNTENVSESAEKGSAKKKNKKKKKKSSASNQSGESTENIQLNSKKRKRKSSNAESSQEDAHETVESGKVNEFVGSNKKRKISHNEDDNTPGSSELKQSKINKKKSHDVNFQDTESTNETTQAPVKKTKKRKHRDEDGEIKKTKVSKDSSFQEIHVPRLPDNILHQLDDKPKKIDVPKVISTSNFIVENARQKRSKPSNYLEESIYLDEKSPPTKKDKPRIKKPKVLPFLPTASISESGFTTNFRINKLSQFTTFEAEPVVFSKENYLQKKKIKRLGTYDRYKNQMHHKMSKF